MRTLRGIILPVVAAGVAVLLVLIGLWIGGFPPVAVLREWILGAVGSKAQWAASLQEACPLLLTGLAAGVAFRTGVLNIGAEGQFMIGALFTAAVTTRYVPAGPAWWVLTVAIVVGAAAGALWAGIAAALEYWRGVPVVLSTILLNFVAAYVVAAVLLGPLQARGSNAPQTPPLAERLYLPVLMNGTQLHIGVLVALGLAVAVWVMQARTVLGFELLVTGLNPRAARLAGVPVARRQMMIMAVSGACAGLGGALELTGVTHFLNDAPANYGYAGIAVALLGRLHPLGIVAAAIFFGMLDAGARHVEKDYALQVPHAVADIVKGAVVLAMLAGMAWVARRQQSAKGAMQA